MTSARPFRAFVSYCHADAAFAARLQRKLEGYRLPRRLAGQVEPLPGQAPGRIGPVFRDRADLSAATDLSAAVREGIAASSALVVVASPDAAQSHWVAREIALFRELHPGSPILVALARGEPNEALPDALHSQSEPLCADFRKSGDGKRLAFLKIVAGLAGLPLDALVQRDAQRQVRRVTAVTLGAVILVLIMALLLAMALRAREEAQRQRVEAERRRADAEGLVEYMLTDLRDRLRGTRLETMSAVNQRALAYYASQGDLSRLPDESLNRRARLLQAMGEDNEKMGDLDRARAQFTEAHRTTQAILARRPRDADAIFAHAQSEFWIGQMAARTNDLPVATRHWRAYSAQARALAGVEPGSVRALMEQGYAQGNLCDLSYRGRADLAGAARFCGESIRFETAALAKSPGNRSIMRDLANRHGWMARVERAQGDSRAALASRERERALMDRLLALDPDNSDYRLRHTWADIAIGEILIDSGQAARAAALLERNWSDFAPLLAAEKNYEVWSTGLRLRLFLARAQRLAGAPDHRATRSAAEALAARTAREFPEMAERIQILLKDVN
ncbi:MAG: toll/interleukin-1 receptor domain-containing protein [Allosphingosinicella sp.]